ncbi:hypothetical protein, partial [Enterococcus faecalis]|uniref:hypothetical protein n=1 Tax=Enterococcus faecalis TaxID=1351 RepID=UPI0025AF8B0C
LFLVMIAAPKFAFLVNRELWRCAHGRTIREVAAATIAAITSSSSRISVITCSVILLVISDAAAESFCKRLIT